MPKWNRSWRSGQTKFDSRFEQELHEGVLSHCEYHSKEKIPYTIAHNYQSDFIYDDPNGHRYLIEAKGRFMDSTEAAKYIHIRNSLNDTTHLVFLFYNPDTPFPGAKVRKRCGTKRTHKEWAEKNSFSWFTKDSIFRLFK